MKNSKKPENNRDQTQTEGNDQVISAEHSRREMLFGVAGIGMGTSLVDPGGRLTRSASGRKPKATHGKGEKQDRGKRASGQPMKTGIYNGTDVAAIERTDRIESWIGPKFDVQNIFIPWDDARYEIDDLFNRVLPAIWDAGRTPMLTWELHLSSGATPDDILERVVAGEYDDYIVEWAERFESAVTKAGQPNQPSVYIRLAHEANGNWYPWAPGGGGSTPTEYIDMWQYVRSHVEERIRKRYRPAWMWAVNGADVGPFTMEELYPGDEYVDWMGIDSYNWGVSQEWSSWQSPEELFAEPVERLHGISDAPLSVSEFASSSLTEAGTDVDRKSAWIQEAFPTLEELGVDMTVWFNEDKETDWAIFGGKHGSERTIVGGQRYKTYPAYSKMAKSSKRTN